MLRPLPFILLLVSPLAAQVAGTWTLASEPDLPALINKATASLKPAARERARAELRRNNPVPRTLAIAHGDGYISIAMDGLRAQRMPDSGLAIQWTREDGRKYLISGRFEGSKLVQTLMGEDGMRETTYRIENGRLIQRVTVKTMTLRRPFTYMIAYRP